MYIINNLNKSCKKKNISYFLLYVRSFIEEDTDLYVENSNLLNSQKMMLKTNSEPSPSAIINYFSDPHFNSN